MLIMFLDSLDIETIMLLSKMFMLFLRDMIKNSLDIVIIVHPGLILMLIVNYVI